MQKAWLSLVASALFLLPASALAQTLPQPVTDDLWDVSQGTIVTQSSPIHINYNARDAIGGMLSLSGPGNTIFTDQEPKGTIHTIEWQTPQPITLEKFRLFAYHQISRLLNSGCTFPDARVRGFEDFRLYAKTASGDWQQIYRLDPLVNGHYRIANEEYQGILVFDRPTPREPFLHEGIVTPIYAQEFKAEFTQGGDPTDFSQCILWRNATGPRVVELDGFGSTEPPEPQRQPVVIVPGMLASLSPLTTFLDEPSNFWIFNLVARGAYNSLMQQFEAAEYFENEDVFFAHYDWKDPVSENAANYLKPVIDSVKDQTGAAKVDVVAHSMGGLVARSYIQSDAYENDIDQLITLGTPHKGAADAYVAWEGGDFPSTWSIGIKGYIKAIELALRKSTGQEFQAPLSFRTLFPSLRDLLPITPFVTQNEASIPVTSLTEQNNTLQQLQSDIDQLEEKGIDVTAIVGTGIDTLATIAVSDSRTPEDEALDRWRDGHPVQEPIQPNSQEGDQRVLIASAEIGDNVVQLSQAQHDNLPEDAQEEILEILGIEMPEPFHYEAPDINSLLGVVVLSPINPTIVCGNDILSKDQNTFDQAQYIADPEHPNGPKILTIGNPPEGACTVELTGTDAGEYAVITTFADEDDVISTQREGTTSTGKQESFSVFVSADSLAVPAEDIVSLTDELTDIIRGLKQAGHIEPKHFGRINGQAGHLAGKAKSYEHEAERHGLGSEQALKKFAELQEAFGEFRAAFERHMADGLLTREGIRTLSGYVQKVEEMGLQ